MAKRRPILEPLEARLCMAAPALQATVSLPSSGSWTATPYRASPITADIFNNGKDDLITVTAGAQLVAYATGANGALTPVVTYQVPAGVADIKSTPIVVTNPQTGEKDLFAAMGRDEANSGTLEDGRVFGWDLQTGQLLPGWTSGQSTGVNVTGQTGVYGPLTSGVLEGNGMPDIVVTSFSHNVTAFRLDGSTIWQWTNDDTIVSGAVIGDIDRSGTPSVIVGGDSSSNGFYQAGGWVNVLSNTGILKWRHFIPGEVTWASPTLADLQGNGQLDIVIGTGLNYQSAGLAGSQAAGNYLYALDPFGNVLPGWPYHLTSNDAVAHEVLSSVAAADLLGNGQIDIVAIDRAGYLHAIAPNGQDLPGFAGGVNIAQGLSASQVPDDYASPIIADINGDGKPDIIAAAGPYLRAFDSSGHLIWSVMTSVVGGLPEGIDAAAAVGNMNGGATGTLAFVSYNTTNANRPDQLQVYSLPQTTLTAPWPMQRRDDAGDAVERSATFDHAYVAGAFQAALGAQPSAATLQYYDNLLDTDAQDLTAIASDIITGTASRQVEITRIYQAFLGHAPDPTAVASWSTYLNTGTIEGMELLIVGSPEFANLAGNTLAGEVTRFYQAALSRTPGSSETAGWVATGLSPAMIAYDIFNSPEATTDTINSMATALFGPVGPSILASDSRAAMAYDLHHGISAETIMVHTLANAGNYAASSFQASYTRDIYRDVLHREASPDEVASWINSFDSNPAGIGQEAYLILNSAESRADVVNAEFEKLLGRAADAGAIAAFSGYASRESLIEAIVASPEYYAHAGGTLTAYISQVYSDLAGISPTPQQSISAWLTQFNKGVPLVGLAQGIIANPQLYDNETAVTQLMQYLPNETLGVLRTGNLSPTAAGQPINPTPSLLASTIAEYAAGASDEQVLGALLASPAYTSRVTYFKGIYRSAGIRD